jgi:hypothetical protein
MEGGYSSHCRPPKLEAVKSRKETNRKAVHRTGVSCISATDTIVDVR